MHDCAHAPYSHTCEEFYESGSNSEILDQELIELIDNKTFTEDYEYCSPAPHEKASAIILLSKRFRKIITERGDDELIARMIIGCQYWRPTTDEQLMKNALIQLLNSKAIDVDKLDYILRDTWSSGINNISIDVDRLLNSLTITKTKNRTIQIGFKKNSLSVIKNVVDARNYLFLWVYGHHKVVYEQELMKRTINNLSRILNPHSPDDFISRFFSIESFIKTIPYKSGKDTISIYLPADSDIQYLIKKYKDQIPEAEQLLYRKHQHPVWKTFFEFHRHSGNLHSDNIKAIRERSENILNAFLKKEKIQDQFITIEVKPKIKAIAQNLIFIDYDGEGTDFESIPILAKSSIDSEMKDFFYIYGPAQYIKTNKSEIIDILFMR